jgi:hypothetical protein
MNTKIRHSFSQIAILSFSHLSDKTAFLMSHGTQNLFHQVYLWYITALSELFHYNRDAILTCWNTALFSHTSWNTFASCQFCLFNSTISWHTSYPSSWSISVIGIFSPGFNFQQYGAYITAQTASSLGTTEGIGSFREPWTQSDNNLLSGVQVTIREYIWYLESGGMTRRKDIAVGPGT